MVDKSFVFKFLFLSFFFSLSFFFADRHTVGNILTVEILGEENSGVRGHRTTPAWILDIIATAVDVSVLGQRIATLVSRWWTGWVQRSPLQRQGWYETSAIVFVQAESVTNIDRSICYRFAITSSRIVNSRPHIWLLLMVTTCTIWMYMGYYCH